MHQKININNMIKSTFVASAIAIGIKVFLDFYPVQTHKAKIDIPFLTYLTMDKLNCVAIGKKHINDRTVITLETKSLSKKFAKNCLNKGIKYVQSILNQEKYKIKNNYKTTLNKYNNLRANVEMYSRSKIDLKTLFLLTEYIQVEKELKEIEFYESDFLDNIQFTSKILVYKNKWRYFIISFLLSFWLIFVSLEFLKNEE